MTPGMEARCFNRTKNTPISTHACGRFPLTFPQKHQRMWYQPKIISRRWILTIGSSNLKCMLLLGNIHACMNFDSRGCWLRIRRFVQNVNRSSEEVRKMYQGDATQRGLVEGSALTPCFFMHKLQWYIRIYMHYMHAPCKADISA